ncbi:hypothetical protein GEMRC1_005855 [Eukaryota sp. GEM-RC1]
MTDVVSDDVKREIAKHFIDDFLVNTRNNDDRVSKKRIRALYEEHVPEKFRFPAPRAKAFFSLIRSQLNLKGKDVIKEYMVHSARLFPHDEEVSVSSFRNFMKTYENPSPEAHTPKPTKNSTDKDFHFNTAGSSYPELCIAAAYDHYLIRVFISAEQVSVLPHTDPENALVVEYKGRIFIPPEYQLITSSGQTKTSIYLQLPIDADIVSEAVNVVHSDHWIDITVKRTTLTDSVMFIDMTDEQPSVTSTPMQEENPRYSEDTAFYGNFMHNG